MSIDMSVLDGIDIPGLPVTPENTNLPTASELPESEETVETHSEEEPTEAAKPAEEVKKVSKPQVDVSEMVERKLQEAIRIQKETQAQLDRLTKDPLAFMKEKLPNFREQAEKFLYDQIQEEALPAAEKEKRELQKQLDQYKAKEDEDIKSKEAAQEAQESAALRQKYVDKYNQDIGGALEGAGLPKNPNVVKRVATHLFDARSANLELSAEEAVALVKADYLADIKDVLANLDDLLPFLGDEIANKLRKADLARVKSPTSSASIAPKQSSVPPAEKVNKRISSDEFRAKVAKAMAAL